MKYGKIFIALLLTVLISAFVGISNASSYYPTPNETGAFYNGSEITYVYTGNYTCYPPLSDVNSSISSIASSYPCYVGAATAQSQALPDWILVPAYAGMSIFGVNSTSGMPVFRNSTVYVNCGAGNSSTMCISDPKFVYSPDFALIENLAGEHNLLGLPEGVMPYPAHSHLINNTFHNDPIPWYVIIVYVFDPNIMPNVTNGKCVQAVASNVSNPTENCLTSLSAIKRAMQTEDNATANANAGNPIWGAIGKPNTEVYIPNDTSQSEVGNPNTNIVVPFAAKSYNFYLKQTKTSLTTTIPQSVSHENADMGEIAALIVIIAIIAALYAMHYNKSKKH
ncbi:MAG: hypothetical protein QW814_00930 [Methanothrix sp.]